MSSVLILLLYKILVIYLNKMIDKKEAKAGNLFHKAVHLWVMVGDQILIQQRSENKKIYPNMWDISVAGHIAENDSCFSTLVNEAKEELNIDIENYNIEYLYCLRRTGEIKGNMFFDTFVVFLPIDFDLKTIKLEKSEVKDVKLVNKLYLEDVINDKIEDFAPRKMECTMFNEYLKSKE